MIFQRPSFRDLISTSGSTSTSANGSANVYVYYVINECDDWWCVTG